MELTPTYLRTVALKPGTRIATEYPLSIPAIRHMETVELHPAVTFFIGENGSGKSTLLEALAVHAGINAEGGSSGFQFSTKSSHSNLHELIRVVKGFRMPKDRYFLRAESFYNVATEIERLERERAGLLASYGGKSLHTVSHGESFLALLMERFRGDGLYLLDEPEAALSPARQLAVLSLIHRLVRANSQFIIATHSPILMAYPHAKILAFSEEGIHEVDYKDTEYYRVTHDFLNRTDVMLRELLAE